MTKSFCDCCGNELEHKSDQVQITTHVEEAFSSSPREYLFCKKCYLPLKKMLTGNGKP